MSTGNTMTYIGTEDQNFAAAVGIDRAKVSAVLRMPIYLQGETTYSVESPFMSIFSYLDNLESYCEKLRVLDKVRVGTKCVELPERFASTMLRSFGVLDVINTAGDVWRNCKDYITHAIVLNSIEDSIPVGFKTVSGDIFLCDFIHGARKHSSNRVEGFFEWALQVLEVPVDWSKVVAASLDYSSFIMKKVKEVRIEEELDREALDRAINEKVEKVIESVKLAARSEVAILEAKLVEYDKKLSRWKEEAFKEFIATMEKLPKGWTFTLRYGEPALHYKKKIKMEKVKVANKIYSIDNDRLFIKDLYIHGLDTIKSARATGFHPNLGSSGTFCVGDLEGTPTLENLDNLLELCKCGSVDEGYGNAASDLVQDLIESGAAKPESVVFVNEETFEA